MDGAPVGQRCVTTHRHCSFITSFVVNPRECLSSVSVPPCHSPVSKQSITRGSA
ncbi:hypothetical protein BaRGS_00012024, partial [Batillaria attramentaria]